MTTTDTVGFGGQRGPVLIALMLSTGLVAIEATILATAVPTIVADIGGFASFPWLFSAYLLAQAVTVPVYSKLADTIGRKPIMLVGISLFLVGSILCGVAWSMGALIAFRAVQGLGAGAVMPMAVTIAGDLYNVRERAKVTGYFGSVWAAASVVGPTLGGLFAEFATWRWIFFVNIPLCIIAIWMIVRLYHEQLEPRQHRIDVAGAVTLTLGLTAVILGLLEGGQAFAWSSWQSLTAFGFGAVMLIVFVFVERHAAEPVLPIAILSRRLILTTSLISMGVGAALIGLTSYVPTFLEVTTGVSPIIGGLAVASISIGWPIASSQSAKIYTRIGFRATAFIGLAVAMFGTAALFVASAWPNPVTTAISCLFVGFGLGLATTPTLVAAQSSVPWHERAVVTGTNRFTRSIGSAVGVAVFGTIANAIVLASMGGPESPEAIQQASSAVFLAAFVAAVLTVGAAIAMPRVRVEDLEAST